MNNNSEMKAFLPVKITDNKWAELLMDGQVYMRSLYEFGVWNIDAKASGNAEEVNNSFRGDIHEGIARNIDPTIGDDFYNTLPQEMRNVIKNAWYLDDNLFKYLKIYSMYCLTYNIIDNEYEPPDSRLSEFGDTAVIIYNPDEFLDRILLKLSECFGDNVNFKIDEVEYFDISGHYGDFYSAFWKTNFYRWQKELRIAIGLLDGSTSMTDSSGRVVKPLIQDLSPLILNIGDIRDISISISTTDLIDLKLPPIIDTPDYTELIL